MNSFKGLSVSFQKIYYFYNLKKYITVHHRSPYDSHPQKMPGREASTKTSHKLIELMFLEMRQYPLIAFLFDQYSDFRPLIL